MRKFILIALLIVSVISCKEKTESDSNAETTNIEDLVLGPIVHESLSEKQLENIKFIQEIFNEVCPISLEETITNFKRDQNPDNEINVWLNMAKTFQSFVLRNLGEEKLEVRKEAFKLILMRSMMLEKEAIISSELKLLNDNEIREILKNYTLDAKSIKVEKK
jgi:hypothetical protein